MDNNYTVYMHITPSGKYYIGITRQKLKKRFRKSSYKSCIAFYKAIEKYGFHNISTLIFYKNLTKYEAECREIELIKYYMSNDSNYGYNIQNGGSSKGKHSQEFKIFIAQKNKERILTAEQIYNMKKRNMKKVSKYDLSDKYIETFDSIKEAAKAHNIEATHISRVLKCKRRTAGGYIWKYAEVGI